MKRKINFTLKLKKQNVSFSIMSNSITNKFISQKLTNNLNYLFRSANKRLYSTYIPKYNYSSRHQVTIDYKKNYYQILKVEQTATLFEIKKCFYNLAKQIHPDKQKGDQDLFKQINQAYNVLSHQQRRKRYDKLRIKPQNENQSDSNSDTENTENMKQQQSHHRQQNSENKQPYYHHSRTQWQVYRSGFIYNNASKINYYTNMTNNMSYTKVYQNFKRFKQQNNIAKQNLEIKKQKYYAYVEKLKQKAIKDKQIQIQKLQKQKAQLREKKRKIFNQSFLGIIVNKIKNFYKKENHQKQNNKQNLNKQV